MADKDEQQIFRKRYKIKKKLGAGNFGTAYLVQDLKAPNELKVLKVVRLGEMDSDQTVDSVHEAELLSNLDNEYIVKFYESFLENDCLCIVTEFCEGGDLDQRFKELKRQNHPLDEDQVIEWLTQILIAVQYMHKSRILHRDLKARNIFLKSNKVKIGDFGISRILVGTMDVANTFTGTPYYMSPEVMKHDGYESKSDIWSVGCLLYEMCTFHHAFEGKGLMNVIYKVVEGKPPELPATYSKELNDILMKMFTKDPKQRPSAAELLQNPFLRAHHQKSQMNIQLENTVNANRRLNEIHTRLKTPINFGELQKQSWSLTSQYETAQKDDYKISNNNGDDDDDDVQLGHNTFYKRNSSINVQNEDESTLKAERTSKSARQAMIERKINEADARAQVYNDVIRSNTIKAAQNRQLMRESTVIGSMRRPWPVSNDTFTQDRTQPKLTQTHQNPARNLLTDANELSANETYNTHTRPKSTTNTTQNSTYVNNYDDKPIKPMRDTTIYDSGSKPTIRHTKTLRNYYDDRPITPMRGTYRQIADKFNDEDGLPTDPNLTNQYYEAYNDFEKDDYSPTREKSDNEFIDQVCRSFHDQDSTSTNSSLSGSQRSTINSLSRTLDPRLVANPIRQSRYVTPSRTINSKLRQGTLARQRNDDNNSTLKDNPSYDAFGPIAKSRKISSLRNTAIEKLGEPTFEKVHTYLIKQRTQQRTDPSLDDGQITNGLTEFVKKPSDCFVVDQLVFLELF